MSLPAAQGQEPRTPQQRPRRTQRKPGPVQIAACLERLGREDASCVLVVKGLARLGFDSRMHLRTYFRQAGRVREVLLANHPGQASAAGPVTRMRPAGMGYVLMERAADVQRVLGMGEIHSVQGCDITVQRFEHRRQDGHASHGQLSQ